MNWAAIPPEVISAEIYIGAGSGPLHAAAAALTGLAADLGSTAAGWESELATLTGLSAWQGAGASAATASAQTYVEWLTTTQAAVEQAAAQAAASAAAFDAVHAAVATPAAIAANRAAYAAALAAMPFSAATVAALEAEYDAMWAQDVAAMSVYQAASGAAGVLPPLVPVAGTINPAADTSAGPAVAASSVGSGLSLSGGSLIDSIDGFLGTPAVFNTLNGEINTSAWFVMNGIPTAVSLGHTLGAVPSVAVGDVVPAGAGAVTEGAMVSSVTPGLGTSGLAGAAASASVGEASTIGRLSVPANWSAAAAPAKSVASAAAPLEGSGWTVPSEVPEPATAMPGMPGMAAAAKGAGAYGTGPRYGFKPVVIPKQVVV